MMKKTSHKRLAINAVLIVLAVILALSFDPLLKVVTGCTRMVVKDTCMVPVLREGDLVFIKEVDPKSIKLGDIVVFGEHVHNVGDTELHSVYPNPPWIHRIIEIVHYNDKLYFKTKGDRNPNQDYGWIPEQAIIGKLVFSIPFLGNLSINPLFRTLNLLLIALLIFLIFYMEMRMPPTKEIKSENGLKIALLGFFYILLATNFGRLGTF